jgi:thymidylate kinase
VLIADRYVYDYILSRIVIRDKSLTLARTLVRITPRPDVVVLLDVNEDIAYNRKCGEKAMDELKSLRKLYLKLVTKLGGHVINASKSKFEVLNNIWKTIRVEMGDYVSGPKKANTHL